MRISYWSSDVCSSDVCAGAVNLLQRRQPVTVDADQGLRIIIARNLAQNIRAGDDHVAASGFHCVDQLGGQGMAVRFARMEKHFRKHAFLPRFGQDAKPFGQEQSFALAMLLFTQRSEEHTSELQSLMRISYDVFCLKKQT